MKPAGYEVGDFAAIILWQDRINIRRNNIQLAFILTCKESVLGVIGGEVVFKTTTTIYVSETPTKAKHYNVTEIYGFF